MNILNKMKAWFIGSGYTQTAKIQKRTINHEPIEIEPAIDRLNNSIRIESMTKKQLEVFARKEFKVELDRRHNKKRLLNQVRKLIKEK
jgi:hypothetical protein|tara:strand:- start:116 stop:379 length:264 start_codon:yes stop_codon:yes gene_type:complete